MLFANLKNSGEDQSGTGGRSRFLFKLFKFEKLTSYPDMDVEKEVEDMSLSKERITLKLFH